jgi:hypothetical protein
LTRQSIIKFPNAAGTAADGDRDAEGLPVAERDRREYGVGRGVDDMTDTVWPY